MRSGALLSLSIAALSAACAIAAGCKSSSSSGAPATSSEAGAPEDKTYGGDRPVPVFRVPASYDKSKPAPLLLILHGYGAGGIIQAAYFRMAEIADEKGFFLAAPDGTVDSKGRHFWNATDSCCDFDKKNPDDVGYLTGLVKEISADYAIDPKRIYLLGHSNGGAMSFRLSCDRPDMFAAMIDLAGPFYSDATKCKPTIPIALLHIHGTADDTVPYDGGELPGSLTGGSTLTMPGAQGIVQTWASLMGCGATPEQGAPMDIEGSLPGAETLVTRYTGCRDNSAAELWSVQGAGHIPGNFSADLPRLMWSFFDAHAKK